MSYTYGWIAKRGFQYTNGFGAVNSLYCKKTVVCPSALSQSGFSSAVEDFPLSLQRIAVPAALVGGPWQQRSAAMGGAHRTLWRTTRWIGRRKGRPTGAYGGRRRKATTVAGDISATAGPDRFFP
jgi:hypothetical protein